MEKDIGVAMIAAATKAIKYKKENPNSMIDEVINHVMRSMSYRDEVKIGAVASASAVYNFKEKNPRANEKEVLRFIVSEMSGMINKLELVNQSK